MPAQDAENESNAIIKNYKFMNEKSQSKKQTTLYFVPVPMPYRVLIIVDDEVYLHHRFVASAAVSPLVASFHQPSHSSHSDPSAIYLALLTGTTGGLLLVSFDFLSLSVENKRERDVVMSINDSVTNVINERSVSRKV